ncbi:MULTISPECIES: hypothetical protein [unclassified Imperialibacter]|uniref:TapB family protein n=1 Tax=unclassified Imperialibacter TaxID=2629706 RepID=UPI0012544C35|nr:MULTISPECIES: hypothetical protein [unclassified Imperialibacter]CAD5268697.1 conserved exported hypothetical protein [Imperialibacter sp. 89]CAD5297098.1 conserved exported hypothetical protein [Imperialibacter sp. 75]VVT34026.1 conserved exported hypothetical protein [Imperialibacter sp. EC-SDR9]
MKLLKSFFVFGLLIFSQQAFSQCNPYFNYTEGAVIERTYFNKKGKEVSNDKMEILSVDGSGNNQTMKARVTMYDKKKELSNNEIEMICEDGVFKMDMRNFMPQGMEGMEDVQIVFEGDQLTIPSDLKAGQSLKDLTFVVKIISDNPAMKAMATNTTVSIKNRKVVGKEKITTAAGTYDCFKMTYDSESTMSIMGMKRTMNSSSVEYLSEGAGMVKSESYDEKGNLNSYVELSAFKK